MTTDFTGGWEYQTDSAPRCTLPPDLHKAFESATRELLNLTCVPVLYVARRAGMGTSYCIICTVTAQAGPCVPVYQALYLHIEPDGRTSLTKIKPLID